MKGNVKSVSFHTRNDLIQLHVRFGDVNEVYRHRERSYVRHPAGSTEMCLFFTFTVQVRTATK